MSRLTHDIASNISELLDQIDELHREAKRSSDNPDRLKEIASELGILNDRRLLLQKNLEASLSTV